MACKEVGKGGVKKILLGIPSDFVFNSDGTARPKRKYGKKFPRTMYELKEIDLHE